jgi:hypothetical protein
MQLSLSAGGSPDSVRRMLADQANAQLGAKPAAAKAALVESVLDYANDQIGDRPDTVSVSVSCSIYVTPRAIAQPPVAAPETAPEPVANLA